MNLHIKLVKMYCSSKYVEYYWTLLLRLLLKFECLRFFPVKRIEIRNGCAGMLIHNYIILHVYLY